MHREQAHDDEADERRAAQHLPRQEAEVLVVDELADEVLDVVDHPGRRRDPPQHHARDEQHDQRAQVEADRDLQHRPEVDRAHGLA